MVPPIVRLLIREPGLFVDHLNAYGDAVALSLEQTRPLMWRALAGWIMLVAGSMVGFTLAGLSLLLYLTWRREEIAYLLVPAIPLLMAVIGLILVKATSPSAAFNQLKSEMREDLDQMRLL
jgi:hypothetical protein